jgi:hypothetical protein
MSRSMVCRFGPVLMMLSLAVAALPVMAQHAPAGTAASPAALLAPANLQELVRRPVILRGTLGDQQIELDLQPKVNEDGLEGKYFVFGQSAQVLVAGEVDQNDLIMEESYNGKDVSGDWQGSLQHDVLSGTWSSLDGSVSKPFTLKVATP